MSVQKDKWVTPLYHGILQQTIGGVILTFATGSPGQCWDALKTLYDVLDGDIQSEVKGIIDEGEMWINKEISRRGYTQSDVLQKQRVLKEYVNVKKHELFEKIMRLLFTHNYLKKEGLPTRVRSLKAIGDALE